MAALMSLANVHDGIPWVPTEEQMRTENEGADGLVPRDDIVLVERGDDLVAFAMVERIVRDGVSELRSVGLRPARSRRRGIGGALYVATCASRRRSESRLEDPDGRVLVRAHAEESEIGHRTLLERRGFAPMRHFFLMRRATLDDVPDVPLPDGLSCAPSGPRTTGRSGMPRMKPSAITGAPMAHSDHDFQVTFGQSELKTDLWVDGGDGDQVAGVVRPGSGPRRTSDST